MAKKSSKSGGKKRAEKAGSVVATTGSSDGAAADAERARKTLSRAEFDRELQKLQRELVIMQEYVKAKGLKIVVIFGGRGRWEKSPDGSATPE